MVDNCTCFHLESNEFPCLVQLSTRMNLNELVNTLRTHFWLMELYGTWANIAKPCCRFMLSFVGQCRIQANQQENFHMTSKPSMGQKHPTNGNCLAVKLIMPIGGETRKRCSILTQQTNLWTWIILLHCKTVPNSCRKIFVLRWNDQTRKWCYEINPCRDGRRTASK